MVHLFIDLLRKEIFFRVGSEGTWTMVCKEFLDPIFIVQKKMAIGTKLDMMLYTTVLSVWLSLHSKWPIF